MKQVTNQEAIKVHSTPEGQRNSAYARGPNSCLDSHVAMKHEELDKIPQVIRERKADFNNESLKGGEAQQITETSPKLSESVAANKNVIWARLKGYPAWPAQVMQGAAVGHYLGKIKAGKTQTLPIMFFGTFEVCWLSSSAKEAWEVGCAKGYENKFKDKRLSSSIQQAAEFLNGVIDPHWWEQPVKQSVPKLEQQAPSKYEKAAGAKAAIQGGGKICKPASSSRKSVAATSTASAAPSHAELENGFSAPRRYSSASASCLPGSQAPVEPCRGVPPPKYEFARKNVWARNLGRPKRLPKDSIHTCSCLTWQPLSDPVRREPMETESGSRPEVVAASSERVLRTRNSIISEDPALPRDPSSMDCGPVCINRQLHIYCDQLTCPCGDKCANKPFHLLQLPKMTVFHTGDRGWGVRADELIPAGTFIVEYTGELLDVMEYQKRLAHQKESRIPDFYMMSHSPGIIIDARLKGNLARLINSSCAPNCETQKWRDAANDETHVGIFACRDIAAGEELSYDYRFEHSGVAAAAKAYMCKCGAAKCRGTMDGDPNKYKDAGRRIEIFWEDDQVYYRGTVEKFQDSQNLHSILYDDGQRTKEDLSAVSHRWLPDGSARTIEGLPVGNLPHLPVIHPRAKPTSRKRQRAGMPFSCQGSKAAEQQRHSRPEGGRLARGHVEFPRRLGVDAEEGERRGGKQGSEVEVNVLAAPLASQATEEPQASSMIQPAKPQLLASLAHSALAESFLKPAQAPSMPHCRKGDSSSPRSSQTSSSAWLHGSLTEPAGFVLMDILDKTALNSQHAPFSAPSVATADSTKPEGTMEAAAEPTELEAKEEGEISGSGQEEAVSNLAPLEKLLAAPILPVASQADIPDKMLTADGNGISQKAKESPVQVLLEELVSRVAGNWLLTVAAQSPCAGNTEEPREPNGVQFQQRGLSAGTRTDLGRALQARTAK